MCEREESGSHDHSLVNLFFCGMLYLLLDTSLLDWDIDYQLEDKGLYTGEKWRGNRHSLFVRCKILLPDKMDQ